MNPTDAMLGPARDRATQAELDATQTVFGRFLLALRSYTTSDQPVVGEEVVWCDEPVDQMVLAGISVLLRSFATQIGMEMRTTAQVREVAERLNRRLSAGIIIRYQTSEAAAQAFHREVILRLRRAHVLGYRPGMSLTLNVWRALAEGRENDFVRALPKNHPPGTVGDFIDYGAGPSVQFFAPLIKSVRELKDRLVIASAQLHRLNTEGMQGDLTRSVEAEYARNAAFRVLDYLDETQLGPHKVPDELLTVEKKVADATELCEIMSAFQVDSKDWLDGAAQMDPQWLSTQILLSFTKEPPKEDIIRKIEVYQEGLRGLLAVSDAKVVATTCARLTSRLVSPLSPAQWTRLRVQIRAALQWMRKWNPDLVDGYTQRGVMMQISDKEVLMDADTALLVAMGGGEDLMDPKVGDGPQNTSWQKMVGDSIVWANVESDNIYTMIRVEILADTIIIDHLAQCQVDVRQAAVAALLEKELSAKTLSLMVALGLVVPTPEFLRQHIEVVEPGVIGAELVTLLQCVVQEPDNEFMKLTLIKAMARAPAEAIIAMLQEPRHRRRLCSISYEIFREIAVEWRWYDQIRKNVGNVLYVAWLLGSVAYERQLIREAPKEAEDESEMSPWVDTFNKGDMSISLRFLGLDASQEKACALLLGTSEADALAWATGDIK